MLASDLPIGAVIFLLHFFLKQNKIKALYFEYKYFKV